MIFRERPQKSPLTFGFRLPAFDLWGNVVPNSRWLLDARKANSQWLFGTSHEHTDNTIRIRTGAF
ncbi:hypothetical protein [Spirosoma aerophilum]